MLEHQRMVEAGKPSMSVPSVRPNDDWRSDVGVTEEHRRARAATELGISLAEYVRWLVAHDLGVVRTT
jgi:hypothetical protein